MQLGKLMSRGKVDRSPLLGSDKTIDPMRWHHYAGLFTVSLATLLLELSLTRVLSVELWYHFGFLIVSTALLEFGASGVVIALWGRLREEFPLERTLAVAALLFGVSVVACFWLMQRIPFDPFRLLGDRRQLLFMPLYYLVAAVPFFCSGLVLGLLFTRGTTQIGRVYAFDLFGAGAGCAALVLVMPQFGGSGSVVVAGGARSPRSGDFRLPHDAPARIRRPPVRRRGPGPRPARRSPAAH